MDILDETNAIERLQFFHGQRLFASDLQGIEAFNRGMRWLHNRSLHQPGIGNGFAVRGAKDGREVTIFPGYALDDRGREIVLVSEHVEQIPPVSGNGKDGSIFYDLTVSYPEDEDLQEAETRQGICESRGVVRLREAPVFCWVRLELDANSRIWRAADPQLELDIRDGRKIRLGRVEISECRLKQDISVAQRRNARPPAQPRLKCCGVGCPTNWEPWRAVDPRQDPSLAPDMQPSWAPLVGVKARISTACGCFVTAPCYSARVEGTRPLLLCQGEMGLELCQENDEPIVALFDGLLYVHEAKPDEFTALLWTIVVDLRGDDDVIRSSYPDLTANLVLELARQYWCVTWMGVEG